MQKTMVMKVRVPPALIGGEVDEGYGKLADVSAATWPAARRSEPRSPSTDGKKVVDLWGGYRNGSTKKPWQEDTIINVFSTTKGVAALSVARRHAWAYLL